MTSAHIPRVTIYFDFYSADNGATITVTEDVLDGLRYTDFDSEKSNILNLNFAKSRLTHISLLERIANDMRELTQDSFK